VTEISKYSFQMPSYKVSDYRALACEYARYVGTKTQVNLHIAFIYARAGVCIGMATNRIGSRSSGAGFGDRTIHAERAVLKSVGDTSLLKDATLVVIRVNRHGAIMGSEPCHECKCHLESAMRKHGLKRVYYS